MQRIEHLGGGCSFLFEELVSSNSCDFSFEIKLWNRGLSLVAGIDEAGRGPLAGPVVAAAVIFEPYTPIPPGLNDSKKLSARAREKLFDFITGHPCIKYGIGIATVAEIDSLNILRATHLAMLRALNALPAKPAHALVDGLPVHPFPIPQTAIVSGDARSVSIAAASVLAKVTRDRLMHRLDREYPSYGFAKHKGYGTKQHLSALELYGPCPEHRLSFAPVARSATRK